MSCRTQIFPFHSIAAEAKRLLFNTDGIIPHHRHSLVQENQWEGGQEEKEYSSKTQKLMSPRNSILMCFTAWGGNFALPTVFQAGCLGVSMYVFP